MAESFEDINDLIRYYQNPKTEPNKTVDSRVFANLRGYSAEAREKIIGWLFANRPKNYGLDIPAINEAIKETGCGISQGEYVQARKLKCDACDLEYQWVQAVDYDMKHDKGLFDACPRCGMPGIDQIEARAYADNHDGNYPAWFERRKLSAYRYMTIPDATTGKLHGWMFNKEADDKEKADKNKAKIERIRAAALKDLAASKRMA